MNVTFTFSCNQCGIAVSATGHYASDFIVNLEQDFDEIHDDHKRGI
jgi:hypothetical protein